MLVKSAADIRSSEITDKKLYFDRREFLTAAGTVAFAAAGLVGDEVPIRAATPAPRGRKLESVKNSAFSTDEKLNKWEEITTYNNYYEFGTDKDSPSMLAHSLRPQPWTVTVDGECNKGGRMNLEDVLKGRSRIGFIASAVSNAGRWSSRGAAFRSRTSSNSASRRRKRNMSSSRR